MAELPAEIARCPVSGGPLRRVEGGLESEAAALVFPVRDGIAALLPAEGVDRSEKHSVQAFYDEVGWKKDGDRFEDTARFLDTGSAVQRYLAEGRARIGRHLPGRGAYLLDVASGPVQFPEYRAYQDGFEHRVCVDFSALALREARANVGDAGILVQGDITNLPFADGTIDAAVSLHTIYHVPRDEQPRAFRELHRVLKPGGVAVVAYSWGHTHWGELSWTRKLLHLPARIAGKARRTLRPPRGHAASGEPELYFHAFDHHWFTHQPWPFRYEIVTNRLFTTAFLERYVRGGAPLALVAALERRFPRLAGRVGRYPLILIFKD